LIWRLKEIIEDDCLMDLGNAFQQSKHLSKLKSGTVYGSEGKKIDCVTKMADNAVGNMSKGIRFEPCKIVEIG